MKESRGQGPGTGGIGRETAVQHTGREQEQQLEKTMYSRTWQRTWQLDQEDGKQACVRYDTVPV